MCVLAGCGNNGDSIENENQSSINTQSSAEDVTKEVKNSTNLYKTE
jgi:hypothetical protein